MARRPTAPAAVDCKFARAGLAGPARYVGMTDTAIDADGNSVEAPICGKCALCGESLRYVFHFVDAAGVAFDAGSNCAKWARLDDATRKAVAKAAREAAALAKAERAEPGYIARKIAEKAAQRAAYLADTARRVADLEATEAKLVVRIAAGERMLAEGDADLRELAAEMLPGYREDLTRTRIALETFRGVLAQR